MVLSQALSGILAWTVEAMEGKDVATYQCIPREAALQFHHICTLDDWVEIPCKPVLHHEHGALVLEKIGPAISLPEARIQAGLSLTVMECKQVLGACGIKLPGAPSKSDCFRALIGHYVDSAGFEAALARSNAKAAADDDDDKDSQLTEFSDILNMLAEEPENQGDPDIKNAKQKVKKKRLKKPKQGTQTQDHMLLEPPKPKGRGRGKGRGKGRGRVGKGKGKGKKRNGKDALLELPAPEPVAEPVPAADEPVERAPSVEYSPSPAPASPCLEDQSASPPPSAILPETPPVEALASAEAMPAPAESLSAEVLVSETPPVEALASAEAMPAPAESLLAEVLVPETPPVEALASAEAMPAPAESLLAEVLVPETPPVEALASTEAMPAAVESLSAEVFLPDAPTPPAASASGAPAADALAVAEAIPLAADVPEAPAAGAIAAAEASAAEASAAGAAGEPEAVPVPGLARSRGPKIYHSPSILQQISPPGCTIRLNRHWLAIRWLETWEGTHGMEGTHCFLITVSDFVFACLFFILFVTSFLALFLTVLSLCFSLCSALA